LYTITPLFSKSKFAGLVTRRKDAEDQRISRVYLTEEGRNLLQPVEQVWTEVEARMLANFTLEERVLLRRLLLQLHTNLTA
jgi:DNA-binding MarR family transcriptional regulator